MTSSHAGTPQARAKIHTTLTDFEIALAELDRSAGGATVISRCAGETPHGAVVKRHG